MAANGNAKAAAPETVNLTIDGKPVSAAKGTNLIEAAKALGVEIPHYCYHPHLSIAGNCRMCQIEIVGAPKLEIACNAVVREGMQVKTHITSKPAADAQAATLEFILINHPLDCTVCDQAGHCKLQDYHYEYNARPSRFLEDKEHKVKAEPLGPTVMLDGERCIMCTRCIRFCDEVTGTSELGMLNRGDRSVIAINQGRELANPLSGTVVDLCPVGALTHREWRFNTRIWFTKQTDSICPGCSTGCNVKVATRDGEVVQVKARMNAAVNKEWLCDEGRYGFPRFLPEQRITAPLIGGAPASMAEALQSASGLAGGDAVIFLSPDLLLEDYFVAARFVKQYMKDALTVIAYRERALTPVEAILISPDYAANFRAAEFLGLVSKAPQREYEAALEALRSGTLKRVLILGDRGILPQDRDVKLLAAIRDCTATLGVLCDADSELAAASKVVLPGRSILEKSGLLINRAMRLQYSNAVLDHLDGTEPEWRALNRLASVSGPQLTDASSDRDLTLATLAGEPRLSGLSVAAIKNGGVCLQSYRPAAASPASGTEARA